MFITELKPLFDESLRQPIAFLGGLASGLLRLDLDREPVKNWLDEQRGQPRVSAPPPASDARPQTITID
ncbi:MAG: hypothetical protein Fur0042_07440 [Cyanophyceae cyanobacterium]